MEKYGYIYKVIHKPTQEYYIGKRVGFQDVDTYLGSGSKWITKMLDKYPREDFKKEILVECNSREELLLKEKEIISDLWYKDNVEDGGKCWNMTSGGHSSWDTFWENVTEEEREAFSRRNSVNKKGNKYHLGFKHSEESRKKMSERAKQRKASEETREKMSKSMMGKNSDTMKKLWADPEFRKNRIQLFRKGWEKRKGGNK